VPEGYPYTGTACRLATAGTSTFAPFPWRSARLRSSRSQSGQEWRRGGGAGGVGEGMPVLRGGYGIVSLMNSKKQKLINSKSMKINKSVWDMILKVVIAVASAIAGVVGANAMN
jgi:hypothetical protein